MKDEPKSEAIPVRPKNLRSNPAFVLCKSCGNRTEANRPCSSCGNDPSAELKELRTRLTTPTPLVGGACSIAAGVLAVVQGILFIVGDAVFISMTGDLIGVFILLGVFEVVFGSASINAGMNARRGVKYRTSLIGSVLGMVAFGFGIGGFLGLVAVMLIALSHDEFKS